MPRKKKEVKVAPIATPVNSPLIKLDLGCGKNKKTDFIGVDAIPFPGVDQVVNLVEETTESDYVLKDHLRKFKSWPWPNDSVDEVNCSHFIEHLDARERIHFINELYRILKPGCKADIVAPDWSSQRSFGDLSHKYPPIAGFHLFYLDRGWRDVNAPHLDIKYNPNGLDCNFSCQWGFSLSSDLVNRNTEYQQMAMNHWKDACQDIISTWVKN